MTTHEHKHEPEHAHAHSATATPRDATSDVAVAARTLYAAAERLGPRITEHGPGCPAQHAGPCTCGSTDFINAMHALGAALALVPPQNGG